MKKETLDYIVKKTHELINAPTCSAETKESAERWLNAVGTDNEKEETIRYIAELEADIMPILRVLKKGRNISELIMHQA